MKRENFFVAVLKHLGTFLAGAAGLLALGAVLRFLHTGFEAFFDSNFTPTTAIAYAFFAFAFVVAFWPLMVLREILKRWGFDLDTTADDYTGPEEPIWLRTLKNLVSLTLTFSWLIGIGIACFVGLGDTPETAVHELWPEIFSLVISVPMLVLIDFIGTAIRRAFRRPKPRANSRHLTE